MRRYSRHAYLLGRISLSEGAIVVMTVEKASRNDNNLGGRDDLCCLLLYVGNAGFCSFAQSKHDYSRIGMV